MIVAAFTGTQAGMSLGQRIVFALSLRYLAVSELHVGDCIGADADATGIAQKLGVPTICHPPVNPAKRAFTEGHQLVLPAKPYLERNRDMVDAAGVLIATPRGPEDRRSGTWYTIRYARRTDVPAFVIPRNASLRWITDQRPLDQVAENVIRLPGRHLPT